MLSGGPFPELKKKDDVFLKLRRQVMKGKVVTAGIGVTLTVLCAATGAAQTLDRTALPIPEPRIPHSTIFDVRNATPPPQFEVKAPTGAPNVLIILIDDMGYGQSSAFGGP